MPAHVYKPLKDPPALWERILVHPLETTVLVAALVVGALVVASLAPGSFTPSQALKELPLVVVITVSTLLLVGAWLGTVGLFWVGDTVSTGWELERWGWILLCGGFQTYAGSVIILYPHSVFSWGLPAALGLGCFLRFVSVLLLERNTRRMIAQVRSTRP